MRLWLLLAAVFIVQEPISTSVVLLQAYQSHYNVWLIHVLFTVATLFDVVVTYFVGRFIQKKIGVGNLGSRIKKSLEKFSSFIGDRGKIVALIVYSPMIFPLSGFLAPWLDISLLEALIYMYIGEVVFWYSFEWLLVLGIKTSFGGPEQALDAVYAILILSAIVSLGVKYFIKKSSKKEDAEKAAE